MKLYKIYYLTFIRALFSGMFFSSAYAQNTLSGTVTDVNGYQLQGVDVYIKQLNKGTTTNSLGEFVLKGIPNGSFTVTASFLGFGKDTLVIEFPRQTELRFVLKEIANELDEVILKGKSQTRRLRETAYKPSILDSEEIRLNAIPLVDMVGQMSGVKIRQQGGMGSHSNISINGISGKGVRVYVDNIPIYLLGRSFQLNNIAPSLIKNISIYKGVVPIEFGGDALGGIVNISTQNSNTAYWDVSYTIGSWNTHMASINTKQFLDKAKHFFIELDASVNYSDNDYKMHNVMVLTDTLGNTKMGSAKRFNDQYNTQTARLSLGAQSCSWADVFKGTIIVNKTNKEWQHGIAADRPWGETHSRNYGINTLLTWQKALAENKWKLQGVVGYNHNYEKFTDTVAKAYYWDGNYVNKVSKGESGFYVEGRTPKLKNNNLFGRFLANRKVSKNLKLNVSSLISHETIKGSDDAGTATFKYDFYKNPQKLSKFYIGLSAENGFFNNKLTNTIYGKYFFGSSKVVNITQNYLFENYNKNQYNVFGYGDVLKYTFTDTFFSFLGYERTIRLPDSDEIFGDGISIAPSPNLNPESSHNINLGFDWKPNISALNFDVIGFYRNVSNQIFLRALNMAQSSYLNLHKTKTLGLESNISLSPINGLTIYGNATWMRQTLEAVDSYGYLKERYVDLRIPNTPYLYANAGMGYSTKNKRFKFNYATNYVKSFFVSWENDGSASTKAQVPTQFIHHASINYTTSNKIFNINISCRNILNTEIFDNYSVQKPGRSFYIKTRFFIN